MGVHLVPFLIKKEIPAKLTEGQRKQIQDETGTNVRELNIDTGALSSLSEN